MNEFQRSSTEQGQAFEQAAIFLLKSDKWNIVGTHMHPAPTYPEIDIVAEDPFEVLWWIESKGSYKDRPGLQRDDTVKKALGVANDLMQLRVSESQDGETPIPYMLITSHLPREGTQGDGMLKRALGSGLITQIRVLRMEIWTP